MSLRSTTPSSSVGNNVSHSKRRTKRTFNVNLFNKKFYWVEEDMWITLTISAAGLRTINKKGLNAAIKEAAEKGYLTDIKTLEF
ncbi:MAG: 50S ribosomal protein L28 [Paramuribaculum sp.]|nr:50S ribosomal protein L28 [Paramuribaculum sp.]